MVRCADCRYEGRYNVERESDGMRFMRCNAPGGGPTDAPISLVEGFLEESCDFFVVATEAEMQIKAQNAAIEGIEQKTFEGRTLDDARSAAITHIPEGMLAVWEQVVSEGQMQSLRMTSETPEMAFAKALLRLPVETQVTDRQVVGAARRQVLEIRAKNAEDAAEQALAEAIGIWGDGAIIGEVKVDKRGKRGFLGVIGTEKTLYTVETLLPAEVELTYRTPVTVSVQYSTGAHVALRHVCARASLREEAALQANQSPADYALEDHDLEEVVQRCPPSSIFMTALADDQPVALLRIDDMPQAELNRMKQTVASHRVVLSPRLVLDEQYPLLGLSFFIYDNPLNPYVAKSLSNIAAGDVQEFLLAVARVGAGQLLLYDTKGQRLSSGNFSLVMPIIGDRPSTVMFPVKVEFKDLMILGKMIQTAATHLKGIPSPDRDFQAALQRNAHEYGDLG